MAFGVYVHFPYCERRCPYCDFAVTVRRQVRHQAFRDAVLLELEARRTLFLDRTPVSLYFGGGTPSLWAPECVAAVGAAVGRAFPGPTTEVTLEANPEHLDRGRLAELRAAGVDRLSLGAQSLDDAALAFLGRRHRAQDVTRAVDDARTAGFANLSLDLIFGLPGQDRAALDQDLDGLLALAPDHLSLYALTIEDKTRLGLAVRRGEVRPTSLEREADLFQHLDDRLAAAGLLHYEISNYARPGREAVHNDLYWSGGEWLGLGNGAHSFRRRDEGGGERFATWRSIDRYLQGVRALPAAPWPTADPLLSSHQLLDDETLGREAIWLGLRRLRGGVGRSAWAARYGADPALRFAPLLAPLVDGGLVEIRPDRLLLTRRGALLADEVALRFL